MDGNLEATTACSYASLTSTTATAQIGAGEQTSTASNYWLGKIDEVAIFNTARTAAQIQSDYNARRLADTTTGLVGLWHFDEGQGTRAYDSSGNANHGTLTNMAATAWVNSQNDRDQSALSVQTLGVDPNWANGPVRENYAMNFNGSSNYISFGNIFNGYGSTGITVSAWINTTSSSSQQIAGKWNGTGSSFSLRTSGAVANKAELSVCSNAPTCSTGSTPVVLQVLTMVCGTM